MPIYEDSVKMEQAKTREVTRNALKAEIKAEEILTGQLTPKAVGGQVKILLQKNKTYN